MTKELLGVSIPKCWICEKLTAVLHVATVGGPFMKVCDECLKYGKKVEYCDVDNNMDHEMVEFVNIKQKK